MKADSGFGFKKSSLQAVPATAAMSSKEQIRPDFIFNDFIIAGFYKVMLSPREKIRGVGPDVSGSHNNLESEIVIRLFILMNTLVL